MNLPLGNLRRLDSTQRVAIELTSIFGKLKHPLELFDLLRGRARREVLHLTVLDESLAVFIMNILHVDIADALDEIPHGSCRILKNRGSNLALRVSEAVLEEGRESHRYWPGDIHREEAMEKRSS